MDQIYQDVVYNFMWDSGMENDQNSDNKVARSEWTSDEQEVARVVEDLVSSDAPPDKIADKAEKLHDSGRPHKALKFLLQSLD
ncbi:hypothetical protein D3D01_21140 [Haloarcula sp. Atlit-7R]|nr:hypothetical protein D3D01_21140 [Haloarcula sp. Atlit-7R]